jgi:hypothetical protein
VLNWRIRIIGSAPEFYPKTALWCVCVCVQAVCSVLVMAVELGLLLVVRKSLCVFLHEVSVCLDHSCGVSAYLIAMDLITSNSENICNTMMMMQQPRHLVIRGKLNPLMGLMLRKMATPKETIVQIWMNKISTNDDHGTW